MLASLFAASLLSAPLQAADEDVDLLCARLAEFGFAGSVLVARGDQVLTQKGYGLADRETGRVIGPDTIFDIGSVTKQFTATAILLLEQRDELSTDDSLAKFFEDVPGPLSAITLDHLLSHTSGLPTSIPVGSATTERDALLRAALASELTSPPGEEYAYNNVGYLLLGAVIEVVSGETYEDFVRKELFARAKLEDTDFLRAGRVDARRTAIGYEGERRHGPAQDGWYSWGLRGAGGVLSTTGDLHRWVRAVQSGRILGAAAALKLFTAAEGRSYARGWMVGTRGDLGSCIYHGGTTRGFEAALDTYPDRDLVVIVLCNDRGTRRNASSRIARVAAGLEEAPAPSIEVDLDAFAGIYASTAGGALQLRSVEGRLLAEPDIELLVRLATGTPVDDLGHTTELERRATGILALLERGNAKGLAEWLDPRFPNWNHTLTNVWRGWELAHGAFLTHQILGTHDSRVLVRLDYSSRSTLLELLFNGELMSGFQIDAGLPETRAFLPRSPGTFEVEKLRGAPGSASLTFAGKKVTFATTSRGKTRAIEAEWRSALAPTGTAVQLGLGEFEGTYSAAPGGKVKVLVEGDGLALELDIDALVSLATGESVKKLASDTEAKALTRDLFRALEAGDTEHLAELLTSKWPTWPARLQAVFEGWERDRGALRKARFLGSGQGLAFVALEHETADVLFGARIDDGKLVGFEVDGGLREQKLFPRTGALAFGYSTDERAPRTAQLTFLLDDDGRPSRWVLVARSGSAGGRLTAER